MLFSDNVSEAEESALKQLAVERGLLMMGPDCGTAIIHGVGLGFANVVRRGNVGIVGASGTGIQEISVLLDRLGVGVSHAIGTGGRDLHAAAAGTTTLMGIDLLAGDPATRVIVLAAKPPEAEVARRVLDRAAGCGKPVVVTFLGYDSSIVSAAGMTPAETLEEAALLAARLAGGAHTPGAPAGDAKADALEIPASEVGPFAPGQRYLRGLFSGGTLCYEAMLVLNGILGDLYSNIPLKAQFGLTDAWRSHQHTLVDLGDDEFTRGRAHPMIDPTVRTQRLLREAEDPDVAVVLLDVMLGFGSHPNPAEGLSKAIRQARERASSGGRSLAVVAYVCGTEADPQQRSRQEALLAEEGVYLASSNAEAARRAGAIIQSIGASNARK